MIIDDGNREAPATLEHVLREVPAEEDLGKEIPRQGIHTDQGLHVNVKDLEGMPRIQNNSKHMVMNRRISIIMVIIASIFISMVLCGKRKIGDVSIIDQNKSNSIHSYIISKYDGFLNGNDVALFIRHQDQWKGFYLSHESWNCNNAKIAHGKNIIYIYKKSQVIAEYNIKEGKFQNHCKGIIIEESDSFVDARTFMQWKLNDL